MVYIATWPRDLQLGRSKPKTTHSSSRPNALALVDDSDHARSVGRDRRKITIERPVWTAWLKYRFWPQDCHGKGSSAILQRRRQMIHAVSVGSTQTWQLLRRSVCASTGQHR